MEKHRLGAQAGTRGPELVASLHIGEREGWGGEVPSFWSPRSPGSLAYGTCRSQSEEHSAGPRVSLRDTPGHGTNQPGLLPVWTSLSGLVPSAGASTGCLPVGELEEDWVTCRAPSRALPELAARNRTAFESCRKVLWSAGTPVQAPRLPASGRRGRRHRHTTALLLSVRLWLRWTAPVMTALLPW